MNQSDTPNSDAECGTWTERPSSAEELGRRLASVVERLGGRETASAIAARSPNQIWKYTKGNAEPPLIPLARLCRRAGVRLEWLAFGSGPMLEEDFVAPIDQARLAEALTVLGALSELADVDLKGAAAAAPLLAEIYDFLASHEDAPAAGNLVDLTARLVRKLKSGG